MEFRYDQTDIHLRYNESRKLPEETIKLWLEAISRYVPKHIAKIVIDLGCGTGRFMKGLSEYFSAKVYGIEPSWNMLSVAKQNLTSSMIGFIQGTAENIPLMSGIADIIFLSMVYHHIKDKDEAVHEFRRILKPNRFLCIRTSTTDSLDSYPYLQFFPGALQTNIMKLPSRENLTNFLQSNGFKIEGHSIISQITAENYYQYFEKIKLRGLSDLTMITDDEFNKGLIGLKKYCCEKGKDEVVFEDIDLFIFRVN
jgi:ubiquinone/menaquinone biosynthesis C-methylase UbiE